MGTSLFGNKTSDLIFKQSKDISIILIFKLIGITDIWNVWGREHLQYFSIVSNYVFTKFGADRSNGIETIWKIHFLIKCQYWQLGLNTKPEIPLQSVPEPMEHVCKI